MHSLGVQFSTATPCFFEPGLNFDHLAWLRRTWPHNLLVEGILHPEDAKKVMGMGTDGVVVSNHGGRQLDRTPATPLCVARNLGSRRYVGHGPPRQRHHSWARHHRRLGADARHDRVSIPLRAHGRRGARRTASNRNTQGRVPPGSTTSWFESYWSRSADTTYMTTASSLH